MSNSQSSDVNLWKGAIFPALIVATFTCICVTVVNGKSGLLAGLLASFTVIIFFSVHLLVARVSRNLDPMLTMALAMFSYFAKVILMGVFLLLVTKFTDRSTVDRVSFAISAILITMAWLFVGSQIITKLPSKKPKARQSSSNTKWKFLRQKLNLNAPIQLAARSKHKPSISTTCPRTMTTTFLSKNKTSMMPTLNFCFDYWLQIIITTNT